MKRQAMLKFLKGKMDFDSSENARHTSFFPCVAGNKVALPKVITLTRSSKELPNNNIKGIAAALHYTVRELQAAANCSLSGATGNISLCVNMFHFIRRRLDDYPDDASQFVAPMKTSIILILEKSLEMWDKNKRTKEDGVKLAALSREMAVIQNDCDGELAKIAEEITSAIAATMAK